MSLSAALNSHRKAAEDAKDFKGLGPGFLCGLCGFAVKKAQGQEQKKKAV